jgi:hypothetical protein
MKESLIIEYNYFSIFFPLLFNSTAVSSICTKNNWKGTLSDSLPEGGEEISVILCVVFCEIGLRGPFNLSGPSGNGGGN